MKRPVRFFNTTGPCNPDMHYMLPPKERLIGAQLPRYIRDQLYWVLHAPRQTGKTTFLQSWMREINAGDEALACYVSVEDCQRIVEVSEAMRIIDFNIRAAWSDMGLIIPPSETTEPLVMVAATLRQMAAMTAPKPLVILFDETDVLEGDPLIRFLRLLRGGFATRGVGVFPTSIALVGMRDLKDYLTASKDGVPVSPGSPFNIKEDSAGIGNFAQQDIARLFAQRSEETGQRITDQALEYAWAQSQGQPWIVNNLFKRATMRVLDEDSRETVTLAHVQEAREQMIAARETHLDSLGKRLYDQKVKRVVQAVMTGDSENPLGREDDEVQFVLDLGLITWSSQKGLYIANPIYDEIITRQLNSRYHDSTPAPSTFKWQKPDGSLDMDSLLKEFQKFWRRHSEVWEQKADYTEAFPHLLLVAFLQRLTNGDGHIEREVAAGSGRMDILVEYGGEQFIIEIKMLRFHDSPATVRQEGLEQTARYRDRVNAAAPAWLVIFDRRPESKELPWEERLGWEEGNGVTVVRC